MITDLTGCFVGDGRIHAGLLAGTVALPTVLPDALFAAEPVPAPPSDAGDDLLQVEPLLDDQMLPQIGEVVDKYRLDLELGRGGFAVVYRATHVLMQTTVALKLLFPRMLAKHPQLAEGMCEEARMISLIDHPNVVRILDVTRTPRFTYIVMEHIDGVSLGRAIARRPLSPGNVLKIGVQLCSGLNAAGAQGLIHCDIKPGNILIGRNGLAKLVDFGLARRADDLRRNGSSSSSTGSSSSSTGKRIAGTPDYLAPEQATSPESADHRADIYALGATLYDAAVGRPPFRGGNPMETIVAHISTPPPPPEQFRPDLPAGVSRILLRMLAKRPEDRPQTYDELTAELLRVLDAIETQTVMKSGATEPPTRQPLFGKLRGLFNPRT